MPYASKERQTEYNRLKWINLSEAKRIASRERGRKYAVSEKGRAKRKANYQKNKEFYQRYERNRQYKKMYGITLDDYERMLVEQDGKCGICGCSQSFKSGKPQNFAVDHCHNSGRVRGLLCLACNHLLGRYERQKEKIVAYLNKGLS